MTEDLARLDDRQITFADFVPAVWRYKWLIAGLVVLCVAVAWAVTVRQPRIYGATTTLLIPKDGAGGLTSTIASLGLGGGSGQGGGGQGVVPGLILGSGTPNRDVVMSVLKSRTLAQAVVERFKLQERYRSMFLADAIDGLLGTMAISLSKDGLVVLTVEETDPLLAADIANFCIEELERLVAQFGLVEAKRHRQFVADQLALAKQNLVSAEDTLRAYQERNRAIVLQDQVRGAIETAGRLKGEIIASEVRLQVMRDFATERDPDLVALRRRVEEMKRQLGQMQHSQDQVPIGDGKNGPILSPDFSSMPLVKIPRVGLELARLTRDFKIQETLVFLLIQQSEQARIAEAKDPPLMRVLDPATPPVRHSRPRLRSSLLIAGAAALVVGLLLTCVLEYLRINRGRAVIA